MGNANTDRVAQDLHQTDAGAPVKEESVRLRDALDGGELIFSTSDPVMQGMIAEGEWDRFLTSSFPSPAAANDVRRVNSVGSGLPFHASKDATFGLLHGAKH